MTIGFLQMEMRLPDTNSLKDKRTLLKKIANLVRNKFNISYAELSENDSIGKSHIGFVTLSNQSHHCHKVLTEVEEFVSQNFNILVTGRKMEMF